LTNPGAGALPKAVPSSFHEPKPSPSKASSTFTAADVVEEKIPAKNSARVMRFITNNLSTEHAGARAECWYGKDFEGNFANQRTLGDDHLWLWHFLSSGAFSLAH
jgi:hypothetical protein